MCDLFGICVEGPPKKNKKQTRTALEGLRIVKGVGAGKAAIARMIIDRRLRKKEPRSHVTLGEDNYWNDTR